jgi:GT2 family glycosyltransferase
MINKKSNHLVVLIGTYNRLEQLKKTLASVAQGTLCAHEIIVIDAGSSDGTIEYLEQCPYKKVTPVFQGKLQGQARAFNEVWRDVESAYTGWLSDDTVVLPGSLDLAVKILEQDRRIGMVGLKMKDVAGPSMGVPYMGALSCYGILNCNHGVLPTSLVKALGGFSEEYHTMLIDPDLTAKVLCTGRRVVMTKKISVHHYREWAAGEGGVEMAEKKDRQLLRNRKIYEDKYAFLGHGRQTGGYRLKARGRKIINRLLFKEATRDFETFKLHHRHYYNLLYSRYIRIFDSLCSCGKKYHLVQEIPGSQLAVGENPYWGV